MVISQKSNKSFPTLNKDLFLVHERGFKWKLGGLFPPHHAERKLLMRTNLKKLKIKIVKIVSSNVFSLQMGSGCSTAVKHSTAEQNSLSRGFVSRRVLGFLLLSLSLPTFLSFTSGVSLISSLEEVHL